MVGEAGDGGALAGRMLGAYRLRERLHEGATTELYRGEDTRLGRAVVVKLLRADADVETVARFVEAARRMASLDHGNVVRVLASGEVEGRHYLAMPLLKESLCDRLVREGMPPIDEAARIAVQAAAGLNAAHTHGFAHGNLTTSNILFDEAGRVALADFGAPAGGGAGDGAKAEDHAPAGEVAEDIYALGAVLYELLAGVAPSWRIGDSDDASGLVPPSAHNPQVWLGLDVVVARALAADPAARYADARIFAQAVRATVLVHTRGMEISGKQPAVRPSGAPRAAFDAPGAILPSMEEITALQGARRLDRRVLLAVAALALVILLACAGSGFAILGGFHLPGGGGYQGPGASGGASTDQQGGQVAIVTATATATPLVTATPTATATSAVPTVTPGGQPTATPGPLPGRSLVFSPTQILFGPSGSQCKGQQTIMNTGQSGLSWSWTNSNLPLGFTWSVAGQSGTGSTPPTDIPIASGQSETLVMKTPCLKSKTSVTVMDSEGFSYQISLVVP